MRIKWLITSLSKKCYKIQN